MDDVYVTFTLNTIPVCVFGNVGTAISLRALYPVSHPKIDTPFVSFQEVHILISVGHNVCLIPGQSGIESPDGTLKFGTVCTYLPGVFAESALIEFIDIGQFGRILGNSSLK